MERRQMLAGLAASALMSAEVTGQNTPSYVELKTWRLHNSAENQGQRVAEYLEHGLAPALSRAGASLDGAFSNVVGPEGPFYITLTQFASLSLMQDVVAKLGGDEEHRHMLERLGAGPGLPFVRVESSLLRCFDGMPQPAVSGSAGGAARIFELRTYESQTFPTLARKVHMFNTGEMQIFQRLGFRPVFFGETIVGSRQPNLTYMLSYDDLAMRDRLWKAFVSDPEWKKLSSRPELKDAEIVANISNAILAPLKFSPIH
jgi:hypothetical protein